MTKEIRDSFVFYRSFIDAIEDLPENQQLAVFKAISYFALNEDAPNNLEGFQKTIFRMAEPLLSANTKRYKNGKKGGYHGKKGGRPRKDEKPQNNPTGDLENNPKITPYKYYNENKNEKSEIIIPNFIDQILFDEFLQQRKKDKNPIEGLALKLTIEDLEKWENEKSGSANLAIKNAIKGGWKRLIKTQETKVFGNQECWKDEHTQAKSTDSGFNSTQWSKY